MGIIKEPGELLAKLECTGAEITGNQYYRNPVVKIHFPIFDAEGNLLSWTENDLPSFIKNIGAGLNVADGFRICCIVEYHEATEDRDTASFKMTAMDANDNILKIIALSNRDVYKADSFKHYLNYDVPLIEFVGSSLSVIKIKLEVKLVIQPWSSDNSNEIIDELKKEKVFTFNFGEPIIGDDYLPPEEISAPSLRLVAGMGIIGKEAVEEGSSFGNGDVLDIIGYDTSSGVMSATTTSDTLKVKKKGAYTSEYFTVEPIPIGPISPPIYPGDPVPLPPVTPIIIPPEIISPNVLIWWKQAFHMQLEALVEPPATLNLQVMEVNKQCHPIPGTEIEEFTLHEDFTSSGGEPKPIAISRYFWNKHYFEWFKPGIVCSGSVITGNPRIVGSVERWYLWRATISPVGDVENPILEKLFLTRVDVPEQKQKMANYIIDEIQKLNIQLPIKFVFDIIMLFVPITAIGACAQAAIEATSGLIRCLIYKHMESTVLSGCSVVFDPDFSNIVDYEPLRLENIEVKDVPDFVQEFFNSSNKIRILAEAIAKTETRYLSAKKVEDDVIAQKHFEACQHNRSILESEMLNVTTHLQNVIQFMVDNTIEFKVEDIENAITKLKNEGLTDEQKEQLLAKGYSTEAIDEFIAKLPELSIEEFKPEVIQNPNNVRRLYDKSLYIFFDSLNKVKRINQINKLKGSDLLVVLFNLGLLSLQEFESRLQQTGYNYLIEGIKYYEKYFQDFVRLGIYTTFDLLEKCKTPSMRGTLAKKIELDKTTITSLSNIADLMRVHGIFALDAVALEAVGVDTVKELSKRNTDNLYKLLNKYWEKKGRYYKRKISEIPTIHKFVSAFLPENSGMRLNIGSLEKYDTKSGDKPPKWPSKTTINQWIKSAKMLRRMLYY